MPKSFTATVALALALLLAPKPALASEKIINGSECQSLYPPEVIYGQGLYRREGSVIFDGATPSGASARYIDCPLVRNNVLNTNGIANLQVTVDNRSGFMWCTASSFDRFGNYISNVRRTPGSGEQVLSWGSSVNRSIAYGSYSVFCVLGLRDQVHTIRFREY